MPSANIVVDNGKVEESVSVEPNERHFGRHTVLNTIPIYHYDNALHERYRSKKWEKPGVFL
jgi:hypothetical protein